MALLAGRVLRDVLTLTVQAIVLVLAGRRLRPARAARRRADRPRLRRLVAVSLSAVSYAVGLVLKSEDALAPLLNMVMVPLMLLSGIMLPMTLGPQWLRGRREGRRRSATSSTRCATCSPGTTSTAIMVEGICVSVGLAALCLWLASRAFIKENA